MGEEVNEVINNICEKLGILARDLIPEMGRMKTAELGCKFAIAVIMLLVAVVILNAGKKKNKEGLVYIGDELITLSMVLIVAATITLIFFVPDFVGWLVSPKAKTFAYVLNEIGG